MKIKNILRHCAVVLLLLCIVCLCCCMPRPSGGDGDKAEIPEDNFKPTSIESLEERISQYELYRSRVDTVFENITDSPATEFEYTLEDGGIRIDKYIGQSDIVVIPESIDGIAVTSLSEGAFSESGIRSLYIPDSITVISRGAVANCTSLQLLRLPFVGDGESNTHIGYIFGADGYEKNPISIPTSLETVVVGKLDNEIEDYAFYRAKSIRAIKLEGAKSIGRFAFYECDALAYAGFSEHIESIGEYSFAGCVSLSSVNLEGVNSIGLGAFYLCRAMSQMSLPFIGDGGENTHLGYIFGAENADWNENFVPSSLLSITLLEGCERIENKALANCRSIAQIIFPETLEFIGIRAFVNCRSLASVITPKSLKVISDDAFFGCDNMVSLKVTGGYTEIHSQAFFGCDSLVDIDLSGASKIYQDAFECDLGSKAE